MKKLLLPAIIALIFTAFFLDSCTKENTIDTNTTVIKDTIHVSILCGVSYNADSTQAKISAGMISTNIPVVTGNVFNWNLNGFEAPTNNSIDAAYWVINTPQSGYCIVELNIGIYTNSNHTTEVEYTSAQSVYVHVK